VALETLANLKSYLGVNDSSRDDELTIFLDAAEEQVEEYLGYDPEETTYTDEHHYGTGQPWIYPKARPVTAVTAFSVDDSDWDVDELVLRDTWIDTRNYILPEGADVEITYTAGYSSVPSRIRLAVLKVAGIYDKQHGSGGSLGIDNRSDSAGSSVTFGGETVADILDSISGDRRYARLYS